MSVCTAGTSYAEFCALASSSSCGRRRLLGGTTRRQAREGAVEERSIAHADEHANPTTVGGANSLALICTFGNSHPIADGTSHAVADSSPAGRADVDANATPHSDSVVYSFIRAFGCADSSAFADADGASNADDAASASSRSQPGYKMVARARDETSRFKRQLAAKEEQLHDARAKMAKLVALVEAAGAVVPTELREPAGGVGAASVHAELAPTPVSWFPNTSGPFCNGECAFVVRMCNVHDTLGITEETRFDPKTTGFPHSFEFHTRSESQALHATISKTRKLVLTFALFDRQDPSLPVSELQLNPRQLQHPIVRFRLRLVYADDGTDVEPESLQHSPGCLLPCVTSPPLETINRTLHMQQGRVTVTIALVPCSETTRDDCDSSTSAWSSSSTTATSSRLSHLTPLYSEGLKVRAPLVSCSMPQRVSMP